MSSRMPDGRIVCNSGPLIALSGIGKLHLLDSLFEQVVIPEAVYREVVGSGIGRVGADEVDSASWLETVELKQAPEVWLTTELGSGEAAVITLAHRLTASLVLIDERRARRIAEQSYGLRVKGSAGILVAAKRQGLVLAVRPLLESMLEHGYFLSRRLVERACREAGEAAE